MAQIEVERRGSAGIIRFNRPEKKNAITSAMYRAMSDALEAGDAAPEVAIHVFLGSDGLFTAGNDIHDFIASGGDKTAVAEVLRFIRLLPQVKKPMIAGVDGLAVGIGTTLLFHCDLVYASPRAVLATPFLDLGLVPEAASSLLAPLRMGYARAFELLVMGEPFPAERALASGLVNAVVPSAELEDMVLKAAVRLEAKPPEALAAARRLMRGDTAEILKRTDEEAAAFLACLGSAEAREAFSAFAEKRPPNFAKLRG